MTNPSRGLPPTRCVGESGVTSDGMLGLEILQLLHQLVEFGVADFGIVENVVEVFVVANLLAQGFDLLFDVFRGRHRQKIICGRNAWGQPTRQSPLGIEPWRGERQPHRQLHQIIQLQRLRSAFPGRFELFLNESGVVVALLLQESLAQSPQRARVARIAVEIFAEDFLGTGGIAVHQQGCPQRLTHGIEPVGRLAIFQRVLNGDGLAQQDDRCGCCLSSPWRSSRPGRLPRSS